MVVQLWSYGCTTIRVLVVQLQNSDFLAESTNLDNILTYWHLCIFTIFQIFSKKDFLVGNPQVLKRLDLEFVRKFHNQEILTDFRISPIQRPHYIISSSPFCFWEKVIFCSPLQYRSALVVVRIPPSPFSQRELHILTKPSLLRKEGCNRPPVLRTATL